MVRHREESINTVLAQVLATLGTDSAEAETILRGGSELPDVMLHLRGLRIVLECKFEDVSGAEAVVIGQAKDRIRLGIAHIAVAVVYPVSLRTTPTPHLVDAISSANLKFCIVTDIGEFVWTQGKPTDLMAALRRSQESLAENNIVEETAVSLGERLDGIATLWTGDPAVCETLSNILGIFPPASEGPEARAMRHETSAKVAALVLANALIFQEQLAQKDSRVKTISAIKRNPNPVVVTNDLWGWIWQNINYVPIFQLGDRILQNLPLSHNAIVAFKALLNEAQDICAKQTALRHDLMGRIYHWLLHHAKYLGTYYTSVSAATLLLKLALELPGADHDFADIRTIEEFRIGDLACGTGTLLMAGTNALADCHFSAKASLGQPIQQTDLTRFHRALMERVIYGYDVLASAIHLTASTLALLAPEVAFTQMNLFVMPMGMSPTGPRLGSLDFIGRNQLPVDITLEGGGLFAERVSAAHRNTGMATIPDLDLCAMNPPFVRSVGGNLLFGSLADEDRTPLQTELKRRARGLSANITAGLGSVFVAVAYPRVKPGGRLAFVLPAALVSGEAWGDTRALIAQHFHLELVVTSHDAGRSNFSENTDLSEVMFIARKLKPSEQPGRTNYLNLWRNPTTIYESLDLAQRVLAVTPAMVEANGTTTIRLSSGKVGELVSTPHHSSTSNWVGSLFSQTELLRTYWHLEQAVVHVPGQTQSEISLCPLSALGTLGPDRRRIHDGFVPSTEEHSPYRGVWNHDSHAITSISQQPNTYLVVRNDSPRGPNYGAHLWERSGDILLVERLRSNTQRVLAIGLSEPVLANTWWPLRTAMEAPRRKALLLWLNSSPALLLTFGKRVVTQGAWMQLKQPAWEGMPVLDVRLLSEAQTEALALAYDQISSKGLQPLAMLNRDPVRAEIDEALSAALNLPNFGAIRDLLAREPGLTGHTVMVGQGAPQILVEEPPSDPQDPSQPPLLL